MSENPIRTALAAALALLVACAGVARAGDLTPPGPPGPSMKTLDQVEPRIPIGPLTTPGATGTVFAITAPGSYYLTGDIVLPPGDGGQGVRITSGDVTLDLNGFSIVGGGRTTLPTSFPNAGVAVLASRVTVRNGTIRSFPGHGIYGAAAASSRFEDLTLRDNAAGGLLAGNNSLIARCVAESNGGVGIEAGSGIGATVIDSVATGSSTDGFLLYGGGVAERCVARSNGANGFRIVNFSAVDRASALRACIAESNSADGFFANDGVAVVFEQCAASLNAVNGFRAQLGAALQSCTAIGNTVGMDLAIGSSVIGCTVRDSLGNGVFVSDNSVVVDTTVSFSGSSGVVAGSRVRIVGVTTSDNGVFGIAAGAFAVVSDVIATFNGNDGINVGASSIVEGCVAYSNGDVGILTSSGSTIRESTARSNTTHGVSVGSKCTVVGNTVEFNGNGGLGAGINVTSQGNRIDGNSVVQNGDGIRTAFNRNVIVRNTLYLNSANLSLGGGQTASTSGSPATAGPWDNITH